MYVCLFVHLRLFISGRNIHKLYMVRRGIYLGRFLSIFQCTIHAIPGTIRQKLQNLQILPVSANKQIT